MLTLHFPGIQVQPDERSLYSWVPSFALHIVPCTAELLPSMSHQQACQGLRMPSPCQAAVKVQHLSPAGPGVELPVSNAWQADVSKAHQHASLVSV